MELKRICQKLTCWDEVVAAQQKKQLSAQTIVPDISPDALTTLDSCAVVLVSSKQVLQGRVEINGKVQCLTGYTAPDDGAWKVETSLPFSAVFEDERIEPEDTVILKVWCERTDTKVINSRKIGTEVLLAVSIEVYRKTEKNICCGIEEPERYGVKTKCRKVKQDIVCAVAQKSFDLEDTVDLGVNSAGAQELIKTEANLVQSDHKIVGSKMILKGILSLECLYKTYEGTVQAKNFELPFSQILDLDCDSEGWCELSFYFEDLDIACSNDGYYEGKALTLDARLTVQAICSCKVELECIEDAYSVFYEMESWYEEMGEACVLAFASIDETKPIDKKSLPALVMRPLSEGEQLWDAAKRWNSTVEAICEANGLSDGNAPSGKLLLIPVVG